MDLTYNISMLGVLFNGEKPNYHYAAFSYLNRWKKISNSDTL